jgi:hypothetical protein
MAFMKDTDEKAAPDATPEASSEARQQSAAGATEESPAASAPAPAAEQNYRYLAPTLLARRYPKKRRAALVPGLSDPKGLKHPGVVELPFRPTLVKRRTYEWWMFTEELRAQIPPCHPDTILVIDVLDLQACNEPDEVIRYLLVSRPYLDHDLARRARGYYVALTRAGLLGAVASLFKPTADLVGAFPRQDRTERYHINPKKRSPRKYRVAKASAPPAAND